MKTKLLIILAVAVVALFAVFALQPDPSIDRSSFQSRLSHVLNRDGHTTVAEASCSADQVPLPLLIAWHPRHRRRDTGTQFAIGFPDGVARYTVASEGSAKCDVFVRYFEGRATLMDLRFPEAARSSAVALRSNLSQEFPGFPIRLSVQ